MYVTMAVACFALALGILVALATNLHTWSTRARAISGSIIVVMNVLVAWLSYESGRTSDEGQLYYFAAPNDFVDIGWLLILELTSDPGDERGSQAGRELRKLAGATSVTPLVWQFARGGATTGEVYDALKSVLHSDDRMTFYQARGVGVLGVVHRYGRTGGM